jgi:hypothetical protein
MPYENVVEELLKGKLDGKLGIRIKICASER